MSTRRPLAFDATYSVPAEVSLTDVITFGQLLLTGIGGVGINAGGNIIQNLGAPMAANDAATKAYADLLKQNLSAVASCRAYSNTNIPSLSGPLTIDGVALMAGDRVLLNGQTNQVNNGIWLVQSGAWTRPSAPDFASGTNAAGKFTFIESGNTFGKLGYLCLAQSGSDVIDTNTLMWSQFTAAGDLIAGNGIVTGGANGNTISVALASPSGLQFTNALLDTLLKPTGSIYKDTSGLSVLLNANATLASDANGLRTLGVPALFTVAGAPVDANVTAANLSALNDGPSSLVDALHSHLSVLSAQALTAIHKVAVACAPGDPVYWGPTADTLARSDANKNPSLATMGVASAAIAANATGVIVKRGVATGVLTQATPGTSVYLADGGGLTYTLPVGFGTTRVLIGYAKNATDLEVMPQYLGLSALA